MFVDDTISAIATPIGEGGLAVIRVSGKNAFKIAACVFIPHSAKLREAGVTVFEPNTAYFGRVHDTGEILDEVVLTVFKAPRSYTREDTIEIACHGGQFVARRILTATLQSGARLAQPGEFTKRAFINGRIDLTQAEAIAELISAGSDAACRIATRQLAGSFRTLIEGFRSELIDCLAHIEAAIDFTEEDIDPDSVDRVIRRVDSITQSLQSIIDSIIDSARIRDGFRVAIVGAPNVGKSSLLNRILGKERAIVSPIPGTTRDTVEEMISNQGILLRFIDTAGIRSEATEIEQEGISRSRAAIQDADFVILVLDCSREMHQEEHQLVAQLNPRKTLVALNKCDCPTITTALANFSGRVLTISAKTGEGVDLLRKSLAALSSVGSERRSATEFLVNTRHEYSIQRALHHFGVARSCLANREPIELAASELRLGLAAVGEITGVTTTDDILDRIFSKFCIGK